MRKPVSESTIDSAAADRVAMERWEGEGGRALSLDESLSAWPDDRSRARSPAGGIDASRFVNHDTAARLK